MALPIPPPNLPALLAPILPALPAATVSTEPALAILPLLSPILRQRVQLLSATSSPPEPWLRLLCYDPAKAARLARLVARHGALEPHPVSGDVEVDWDRDSTLRFRRLDQETLHALALLNELDIAFRLVYCAPETAWRVAELTVAEGAALSGFGGFASIAEAEAHFAAARPAPGSNNNNNNTKSNDNEADDNDDGYWDRYDATPARTPAPPSNFASATTTNGAPLTNGNHTAAETYKDNDDDDNDDDDYYAQYDQVQPALDNRDPDEEAAAAHLTRFDPPLGLVRNTQPPHLPNQLPHPQEHPAAPDPSVLSPPDLSPSGWTTADIDPDTDPLAGAILQPRPDSSASSGGPVAVALLEASAGKQAQSEFGVKQHIGRSVRSLWALARASGIERDEFEGIVRTELELLGLSDED